MIGAPPLSGRPAEPGETRRDEIGAAGSAQPSSRVIGVEARKLLFGQQLIAHALAKTWKPGIEPGRSGRATDGASASGSVAHAQPYSARGRNGASGEACMPSEPTAIIFSRPALIK